MRKSTNSTIWFTPDKLLHLCFLLGIFFIIGFIYHDEYLFWQGYQNPLEQRENSNISAHSNDQKQHSSLWISAEEKEQNLQDHGSQEDTIQTEEKNQTSSSFLNTYSGQISTWGQGNPIFNQNTTEKLLQQLALNNAETIDTSESDNMAFLQNAFKKTNDPKIMNNILQLYIDEYQFTAAKQFIHTIEGSEVSKELSWELVLLVEFNTFSLADEQAFAKLQTVIEKHKNHVSNETIQRYQSILFLMEKNYYDFFQLAEHFQAPEHQKFRDKLEHVYDTIKKQKDMPEYYIDALFWVELFNQGFFQAAKISALDVMNKNSHYILPYQILAYANFLTNARSASISYLEILKNLDPTLQEKYTMLLWIAYYRDNQYENSILHLSQIQNDKYRLDKERYLALNYEALHQTQKLLLSREKILWYDHLKPSDFYTYFYSVFFQPYQKGEDFKLYQANPNLADKYLLACQKTFTWQDIALCKYGELWKEIAKWQTTNYGEILKELVQTYPQGYLFHLLGDWYLQKGDDEQAKLYLLKAIGMNIDQKEKQNIKTLLKEILE